MSMLRREIMAVPAEDRLIYALDIIDQLEGQSPSEVAGIQSQLGVSPMQARFLSALNAVWPLSLSRDSLMLRLYGPDWDVSDKCLAIMTSQIRKKHPDLIETVWGGGYRLARKLEVTPGRPPVREKGGKTWSQQDDEDLQRMLANGSDISAIAEEMDRTECAVLCRRRVLQQRQVK